MMITYKSRFLTHAEVWYDHKPDDTWSVDWILYQQRSHPVPGTMTSVFYNYAIDLNQTPEQLQANLNKDTAYKIRRARERDKIVCETCDPRDPKVMRDFEQIYNAFAALKGRAPLNEARMKAMAAAGVLDLSVAKDPQGNALVYHANYRDRCRATSLELPSLYRKFSDTAARSLSSRANRYLTWTDILRYQEQGLKIFDFGGWYHGTDPGMLKINDFKRGFGGQVVREYQCERVLTPKGRVVLAVASLLERTKLILSHRRKQAAKLAPDFTRDPVPESAN